MKNTNEDMANITGKNSEPRTFMIWELAAVYRRLGLTAPVAEKAAIADLRMFRRQSCEPQCQAA